jgi:hypothetical protein
MFSMKPLKKKKSGLRMKYQHHRDEEEGFGHEVREMFIGNHTIFSLIGLAIGGTLIGKTLWEWLAAAVGLPWTLIIGLVVFIASGLALHTFDDDSYAQGNDEEELIQEILEK